MTDDRGVDEVGVPLPGPLLFRRDCGVPVPRVAVVVAGVLVCAALPTGDRCAERHGGVVAPMTQSRLWYRGDNAQEARYTRTQLAGASDCIGGCSGVNKGWGRVLPRTSPASFQLQVRSQRRGNT